MTTRHLEWRTEMTPQTLADKWLTLFDVKVTQPVSQKQFRAEHNKMMDDFKELTPEQQSEFAGIIRKAMKERL